MAFKENISIKSNKRVSLLLFALSLVLFANVPQVSGHGFLYSPRSRNFVAAEDGVWWPVSADNPRPVRMIYNQY